MNVTRKQLINHLVEMHGYDAFGTKDTHGDDLWIATPTTPIKMLVDHHDSDHGDGEDGSQNYPIPHDHEGPMAGALDTGDDLQQLTAAAMLVIDNWEGSSLAEAVNELELVVKAQQEARSARWLVTQQTYVTATNENDALEWVVNNIKAGDQEVKLQTAERLPGNEGA